MSEMNEEDELLQENEDMTKGERKEIGSHHLFHVRY
jgi:hypothetical protein